MEWVTAEAINFINQESAEPFFLYFNPTVPHGSNDVRDALTKFTCRNVANGTLDSDPMIEGMTQEYGSCSAYRQSILERSSSDNDLGPIWVDDSIGALINALKKKGILNNTVFLFQQDHGMDAKSAVYETGVRIAQFIHYPDSITSGSTLDSPVSTVDIAATMLDFADIEPEYEMDGVSWKDAAMGNVVQQNHLNNKRCIFFEDEKDRSVCCGCAKYLELYAQNKDESSTYKSGLKYGHSVDLENLFDLCGGTSTYVTDPANNMEVTNYNLTRPDINIYNVLECHRTKLTLKMNLTTLCVIWIQERSQLKHQPNMVDQHWHQQQSMRH